MNKQELLETYTAEQLAEMIIKAYEKEYCPEVLAVNIGGIPKMFTIKEVEEIIAAYEEIKLCQEQNKQCKTILPSEYLKVLTLNQAVKEKQNEIEKLQSEVEKYRKSFEDAKKERDCQISEYQKRIEELYNSLRTLEGNLKVSNVIIENTIKNENGEESNTVKFGSIKQFAEYVKCFYTVNLDYIQKVLQGCGQKKNIDQDIIYSIPKEPIKVADMLINAEIEPTETNSDGMKIVYKQRNFKISELRQIAEHLLCTAIIMGRRRNE